jgi:N-acylneuraminate cytidylyltransferase
MIDKKKVLALIPARGGSKGIPRKNIVDLAGKPLIAWTIEAARQSKYIDRLVLSSEDEEIMAVAEKWGCEVPFRRPPELAADATPGIEPVLHAIRQLSGYDYMVLLQPTSPFRSVEDIDGCIERCLHAGAKACVTMAEAEQHPHWMFHIGKQNLLKPFMHWKDISVRRQDLPKVYALNGAVYVAECEWLAVNRSFLTAETVAYLMPTDRSLDIDCERDLLFAKFLVGNMQA